jgi:colanic acid biosynthesis glycosyl transferase WcaI
VTGSRRILHLLSFAASALPVILFQKARHPDLVFTVAPTLFSAPLAALRGHRNRQRNWLHIQDFEMDAGLNLSVVKHLPGMERIARHWEKGVYGKFATISTISNAMMKKLVEKGVPPEAIQYFPNWIDIDLIHPLEGENWYRRELHFDNSDVVIVYSGSIGQKQGLETLIEAAQKLVEHSHIHLVICGDGPGKLNLQKLAEGFTNIHFLPIQPAESLNELLNMADIHVLPQKAGAADLVMPSKLLGMLASGRPVIAACPPGSELFKIVNEVGLVAPPENASTLADQILLLASDQRLRLELGSRGRSYVVEHFSSGSVLDKVTHSFLHLDE